MSTAGHFVELCLTQAQRAAFLDRVRPAVGAEDFRLIEGMSYALPELVELIEQDPMTLHKLRHLLFGPKTEKTNRVSPAPEPPPSPAPARKPQAPGHGRTKARDYTGARWVSVAHPQLQSGARCPHCPHGTVREQKSPAIVLRIVGAPPISATGYRMARWRCDTCGEVFTAPTPPEAGTEKYASSVGVTVALLRYGSGLPHYRLAKLQQSLGVPMPASTQWELMQPLAQQAQPILEELITQAAQSPLIRGSPRRPLFHRLATRRREFGRGAAPTPRRLGTAHPDVRCALAQPQFPVRVDPGPLSGSLSRVHFYPE